MLFSPIEMYALRYFLACLSLTGLLAAHCPAQDPPPPPYQAGIESLAARWAQEIQHLPSQQKHKSIRAQKILVTDFLNQRGQSNVLGQQLADSLSDALQTLLGPESILDRKQFQARLLSEGITLADLRTPQVLQWQAYEAGASATISGRLSGSGELFILDLTLTSLPDAARNSGTNIELVLPPDLVKRAREAIDWSPDQNAALSCPSAAEAKGATPPRCTHCPPPSFTDAARRAKWQGNLLLKVAIDEQGQVTSAITLAGAPYGVDEQALTTVRQWQFQPATKDGQPVRTCVPVEVTLRFY